jgi:pimeloyl-ACP methyl ester carboxylesterase
MKVYYQKMGNGPALIILHGLYGSSDNWVSVARHLSVANTVYLVDMRNHGRSPHLPEHTYETMCSDIKELVEMEGICNVRLLGHSMGGKTAMLYAMKYPSDLSGLIVVDIAPVNYTSVDSYNNQVIDHLNIVHAMLSVDFSKIKSRVEIGDELEKTIHNITIRQFIMKNVHRNHDGTFGWKLNIDAISKCLPQIMGFISNGPFTKNDELDKLPVLFIRGGLSDYILPEYYPIIKNIFVRAQIVTIPEAGHWVHAEQSAKFMDLVKQFLLVI